MKQLTILFILIVSFWLFDKTNPYKSPFKPKEPTKDKIRLVGDNTYKYDTVCYGEVKKKRKSICVEGSWISVEWVEVK